MRRNPAAADRLPLARKRTGRSTYALVVCLWAALLTVSAAWSTPVWAETTFVTIGTGSVTGLYYPTGGAISKLVNKMRRTYGVKATAEATGGSVFNINALERGDLDFGLAQSDKTTQAIEGVGDWKQKGPQRNIRGVFALTTETVCLLAAVDSGIKTCGDLRGKIVAIGNPGSGTRRNSLDAISTCGLTIEDLGQAEGLKPSEAASMLQDGRIDAFFFTVGHPNGVIKEAGAGKTRVRFIPFTNTDDLLSRSPFYKKALIPIAFYNGIENSEDIPTFGMKACLLSSAQIPERVVYAVTKEVFEHFDYFKSLHPALSKLTKEEMVRDAPQPLHPGALKYYREAGLDRYTDMPSKK